MTVVVQTPEGIKTGSAVREVDVACGPQFLPDVIPCIPHVKGEAVIVNLGKRGVLFALMRGADGNEDYGTNIVYRAFPSGKWNYGPEGVQHYLALKHAKAVLPPALYPMFVYFKNLKDPKTVESLITIHSNGQLGDKGEVTQDRMAEVFGKGVKLKEVTIELTHDSVTWGLEKWLPWLPSRKYTRGYLGGTPENWNQDPTKTYLTGVEFSKGRF